MQLKNLRNFTNKSINIHVSYYIIIINTRSVHLLIGSRLSSSIEFFNQLDHTQVSRDTGGIDQ